MESFEKYTTGKNLFEKEPELTGKGIPKIIGITEEQYYEYEKQKLELEKLKQENLKLKDNKNKIIKIIENWEFDFYDYECNQLIINKNELNELLEIIKEC